MKSGYARNYLFPQYKAVLSNKKNRDFFQNKINEIEKNNSAEMEKIKTKLDIIKNLKLETKVKCSEKGKLFGSITSKNISMVFKKHDIEIEKVNIKMNGIINQIGKHEITINLANNINIKKILSVVKED